MEKAEALVERSDLDEEAGGEETAGGGLGGGEAASLSILGERDVTSAITSASGTSCLVLAVEVNISH